MAASGVIEVLQSSAMWGPFVAVIVAFLRSRNGRKVTITNKNNETIHAEGLNPKELEDVLTRSKSLAAIDPNKNKN